MCYSYIYIYTHKNDCDRQTSSVSNGVERGPCGTRHSSSTRCFAMLMRDVALIRVPATPLPPNL